MSHTFAEMLDRYELYARGVGFSDGQIDLTRLAVSLFARFLETTNDVENVTANDFLRFLADLSIRKARQGSTNESKQTLSGTTVNTYARVIKAFFSWLSKEQIINENPLAQVPAPRKPKTIPKVYREKELLAVFTVILSVRDRAIFDLFIDSGIRLKELSMLNIGDIDIEKGSLKATGKGGKERFVYFSSFVSESIQAYVKEFRHDASNNDALFITIKGSRLTIRGIQTMLYRLGESAGLKERLSPHKLRHSFATLSLKYGGNLEYIKIILGHSNVKTTSEAYLNVLNEDISAAHRHFSPLSNLLSTDRMKEPTLPDKERLEDYLALPGINTRQLPYKETSHERQIRQKARDLINGIILPLTKDCFIVDLSPGKFVLGKEGYAITVNEKGKIRFGLSIADKGELGLFHEALHTHLETAGLANVLPDILSWSEGVAMNLKNCHELLKRVRTAVAKTYHTSIPIEDDGNPGFTMDFPILICADAVEQVSGSTHFKGFRYRDDGCILKFGGFQIYIGTPDEDLKPFEDAHLTLRAVCAKWQLTKAIAKQRQDLNGMAVAISQQLQKFIAFKRLPGHCELCC